MLFEIFYEMAMDFMFPCLTSYKKEGDCMYINSIDSFPFWGLWPGVCSFPAIRDLVEDELLENIIFFFNI